MSQAWWTAPRWNRSACASKTRFEKLNDVPAPSAAATEPFGRPHFLIFRRYPFSQFAAYCPTLFAFFFSTGQSDPGFVERRNELRERERMSEAMEGSGAPPQGQRRNEDFRGGRGRGRGRGRPRGPRGPPTCYNCGEKVSISVADMMCPGIKRIVSYCHVLLHHHLTRGILHANVPTLVSREKLAK